MSNFLSNRTLVIDPEAVQAACLRKNNGAMGVIRGAGTGKSTLSVVFRNGSYLEITENAEEAFSQIESALCATKIRAPFPEISVEDWTAKYPAGTKLRTKAGAITWASREVTTVCEAVLWDDGVARVRVDPGDGSHDFIDLRGIESVVSKPSCLAAKQTTMSLDQWKKARWNQDGVAENPEDQPVVTKFLEARAKGTLEAMKEFIESLGLPWLEASKLHRDEQN